MPSALARACRVMGCAHVEPCPLHGYEARRGTASARGYDVRWRAFVSWYFDELYRLKVTRAGLCGSRLPQAPETNDSLCEKTRAPVFATLVDHIIPIRGARDPRFFDLSNLQALCEPCHNRKRQRERRA